MARRTKAEAAATREALLDAAEAVFFEKGVARASLEQIARQAGMTRGAVYWHFRNKADLFRALLARVRLPFQELVDEIDAPGLDAMPLEAVRLACQRGFARLERPEYRRVYAILIHRCEFFSDIDPITMQNEMAEESLGALVDYFTDAAARGQLRDDVAPDMAAGLLQSCLGGLFHDWLRSPEAFSIEARGMPMVETLLKLVARDSG
ncbi:TetR family transcriptional regulator [Billgrantia azerbaijanica]|nr:TetR family transcriptional regulator [Halomonas azerbaijanica]